MKQIKHLTLLCMGIVMSGLSVNSCSTEGNEPIAEKVTTSYSGNTDTQLLKSNNNFWQDFLRFDWARRSKLCKKGLGICTMQDKRDAIAEEEREKEILDQAIKDYGIYQSNNIVAPINPVDDSEQGVLDVLFDRDEVLSTGKLELDIKLAQAPSSTPVPLIVDETVRVDISGQIFRLDAGSYGYIPTLGDYGGYHIKIIRD